MRPCIEYRRRAAGAPEDGPRMNENRNRGAVGAGAIYGLGIFGAWVWFWQQAEGFWNHILVFFQGIFWPAWMVYDVFRALKR
jgi:hypothetical protein